MSGYPAEADIGTAGIYEYAPYSTSPRLRASSIAIGMSSIPKLCPRAFQPSVDGRDAQAESLSNGTGSEDSTLPEHLNLSRCELSLVLAFGGHATMIARDT